MRSGRIKAIVTKRSHSSRGKACLLQKASPKTEHDMWLSCEHLSVADTSRTRRTIYSQPSDASGGVLTSLIINLPGTAGLGWLTLGKCEGDAHTLTQSVEAIALSHWTSSEAHPQWANQAPETKEKQINNDSQLMKQSSGDWIHPVGKNISWGMTVITGPFWEHCL